jgi:hypothetical protein
VPLLGRLKIDFGFRDLRKLLVRRFFFLEIMVKHARAITAPEQLRPGDEGAITAIS